MNWTEGNLSRHSRGRQRNELLARQKQHFAKVRNGLLGGGVKKSPTSISFLGTESSRVSKRRGGSGGVAYRPLSSPLLPEKQKRAPGTSRDSEHQLFLREKRRILLDQEDWVGLNLQQPIDINFPGQFQPRTGSRWAKSSRSRPRATQKRPKSPNCTRLEVAQESLGRPFKVEIGNQEIDPSMSIVSRRYSLAPHPLMNSSQIRSNSISSPTPSHARHISLTPTRSNKFSRTSKGIFHEIPGTQCDSYPEGHVKPVVSEEPTYIIHSSSIIHEPIPCRKHNNFMVLNWSPTPSGSEDWGSMRVEIERPARPAPSRQADQEFWKRLISSSSDDLRIGDSTNLQFRGSSSTPVTNFLPSKLQKKLPSYDVSSEPATSISWRRPESSTNGYGDIEIATHSENAIMPPQPEPIHQDIEVQPADDNSTWMKFVFDDDNEELETKAFTEAVHQAAAELLRLPSDTPMSATFNSAETSAACGINHFIGDGKDSDLFLVNSSESCATTKGIMESEAASSNLATAGSTSVAESESRFRFSQPRTFVGKFADSISMVTQGPTFTSHGRSKRRGRPKRKAADGRINIRQLPDYDGDPVEEF